MKGRSRKSGGSAGVVSRGGEDGPSMKGRSRKSGGFSRPPMFHESPPPLNERPLPKERRYASRATACATNSTLNERPLPKERRYDLRGAGDLTCGPSMKGRSRKSGGWKSSDRYRTCLNTLNERPLPKERRPDGCALWGLGDVPSMKGRSRKSGGHRIFSTGVPLTVPQ